MSLVMLSLILSNRTLEKVAAITIIIAAAAVPPVQ